MFLISEEPRQRKGRGSVDRKLVEAPSNFIAGRPKAAPLFWFSVVLDVVFRYLSLFLLYINIKLGKNRS